MTGFILEVLVSVILFLHAAKGSKKKTLIISL